MWLVFLISLIQNHTVTSFISTSAHATKAKYIHAPVPCNGLSTRDNGNCAHSCDNDNSLSSIKFQEEVIDFLFEHNITWKEVNMHQVSLLAIEPINDGNEKFKLGLHLIPTPNSYEECIHPQTCKKLTDDLKQSPFDNIVHLHEDVWQNKNDITKARILAKLYKVRKRWYARNTFVERIPKLRAMEFLQQHHLWGCTRAKFNYGLFSKVVDEEGEDNLIAVATFSPRRHVSRHGSDRMYRSHELIRYCAKRDEMVLGGITKLLAKFCRDLAPDDLVTCIDRDFGDGEGWSKIGFERVQIMPPLVMVVGKSESDDMHTTRRYLVGAGVGTTDEKAKPGQERPGIHTNIFSDLENAEDCADAMKTLAQYNLFPVFDTGVERRMLIVQKSKLENQVHDKKEELGLEDIVIPDDTSVIDIWNDSYPSFPDKYYSPNQGIELLLKDAAL